MCAVCKNVFIAELVYLPVSNLLSIRNRIEWDRVRSRKEGRKEGLSPPSHRNGMEAKVV